jgi:hypothetical protein
VARTHLIAVIAKLRFLWLSVFRPRYGEHFKLQYGFAQLRLFDGLLRDFAKDPCLFQRLPGGGLMRFDPFHPPALG